MQCNPPSLAETHYLLASDNQLVLCPSYANQFPIVISEIFTIYCFTKTFYVLQTVHKSNQLLILIFFSSCKIIICNSVDRPMMAWHDLIIRVLNYRTTVHRFNSCTNPQQHVHRHVPINNQYTLVLTK